MITLPRAAAALAVAATLAGSPAARADLPVIDVSNLVQNALQAARTLEEINNQVQQIQQFVQMLEFDARNVASLPMSILQPLMDSVKRLTTLMGQAKGVLYDIQNVEQQFERLYPATIGSGSSGAQLIQDARSRWENALTAFQHAMEVQSRIVQDLGGDQDQSAALIERSQAATGILQASQAGNQLLALQAKQLGATQALLAAQGRAQALELARQAEAEEQAREQLRRFLGEPSVYTPTPVQAFH